MNLSQQLQQMSGGMKSLGRPSRTAIGILKAAPRKKYRGVPAGRVYRLGYVWKSRGME